MQVTFVNFAFLTFNMGKPALIFTCRIIVLVTDHDLFKINVHVRGVLDDAHKVMPPLDGYGPAVPVDSVHVHHLVSVYVNPVTGGVHIYTPFRVGV